MEKRRARKPEEKAIRKQSIISALRELLLKSRYPLPSVNEIARAAGVSKGVIYFYFHSREEIFLHLHLQESTLFFQEIEKVLTSSDYTLEKARNFTVTFFAENEVFMFLGLIAPAVLEANVKVEFAREFKAKSARGMEELALKWVEVESGLDFARTRDFILRYYYLALMIWQHHHPSQVINDAFPGKDLWLVGGDLTKDLSQTFDWLWHGMISSSVKNS